MHTKIKILSSITYPHVVPNVYYEKYWNLKQSHKKSSKPALLCKFIREVVLFDLRMDRSLFHFTKLIWTIQTVVHRLDPFTVVNRSQKGKINSK